MQNDFKRLWWKQLEAFSLKMLLFSFLWQKRKPHVLIFREEDVSSFTTTRRKR